MVGLLFLLAVLGIVFVLAKTALRRPGSRTEGAPVHWTLAVATIIGMVGGGLFFVVGVGFLVLALAFGSGEDSSGDLLLTFLFLVAVVGFGMSGAFAASRRPVRSAVMQGLFGSPLFFVAATAKDPFPLVVGALVFGPFLVGAMLAWFGRSHAVSAPPPPARRERPLRAEGR